MFTPILVHLSEYLYELYQPSPSKNTAKSFKGATFLLTLYMVSKQ